MTDQREQVEDQHAAEAVQELRPPLGAHPDLEQRTIAEAHRCDFEGPPLLSRIERAPGLLAVGRRNRQPREVEVAPLLRPAEERDRLARADDPDEQRSRRRRRLCSLELVLKPGNAAGLIRRGVLHRVPCR